MQIYTFEGKTYEYDDDLNVEEAGHIFDKSKVGIGRLMYELLVEGNPHAIAAFMWVLRRRAGEAVKWDDTKKWKIATFKQISDDPRVLKSQRELLLSHLKLVDDMLARHEDPGDVTAEDVPMSDPTMPKKTSGKTRGRDTSST